MVANIGKLITPWVLSQDNPTGPNSDYSGYSDSEATNYDLIDVSILEAAGERFHNKAWTGLSPME